MNDTIRDLPNGDFEVRRPAPYVSPREFAEVGERLAHQGEAARGAPVLTPEWHREQGARALGDLISKVAPAESIFDWREWSGGSMPVPPGVWLDVEYRNGVARAARAGEAGACFWAHGPAAGDIVRYRLREPAPIRRHLLEDPENPERRVVADRRHSHYFKDVSQLQTVDVYRVLALFNVADPCLQHAVKKLLVAGGRGGGKDISRDIQEAIDTLQRWQGMRAEEVVS